jgi:hypothetical protein
MVDSTKPCSACGVAGGSSSSDGVTRRVQAPYKSIWMNTRIEFFLLSLIFSKPKP